jgi:hypothetical protein
MRIAEELIDPAHMADQAHPAPIPGDLIFACWSWVPSAMSFALFHAATAHGTDFRDINWDLFFDGLAVGLVGVVTASTGLVLALPDAGAMRGHRDRRYARLGILVNIAALAAIASVPFAFFGYRF